MEFKELEENRQQPNIQIESIEYMLGVIRKNNLKKVLEIGCFNGYSALKFSTVSEEVKTIEIDKRNIEIAKSNFKFYKVNNIIILEGDAKKVLKNLNERFDLILIDATKKEYREYLSLALSLVSPHSYIYADNTISHKEKMKDFFEYLESSKLNWKELNIGRGLVEIRI